MQSQCQQSSYRTTSSNMNCLDTSDQKFYFVNMQLLLELGRDIFCLDWWCMFDVGHIYEGLRYEEGNCGVSVMRSGWVIF